MRSTPAGTVRMIRTVRALMAAILAVSLGCATTGTSGSTAATDGADGAELAAVIDAVKQAVQDAETRDVAGFPPLKKVALKLQTTVTKSLGGEVRYLVASVSASGSAETASTLEIEWTPAETSRHRTVAAEQSLRDSLAQAIHLAKTGIAHAAQGEPPLSLKSISIDLKFEVATAGSAGASVKILPVGVTGTGSISRTKVHTVALTFAP